MEDKTVEIKQVREREIWVGENRFYLDNGLLCINLVGEMDDKTVVAMKEAYFKLNNMVDGKIDALIDLNKAGQQSAGARKTWNELSEGENSGKLALFGMHPVARVMASFVMGVTKKEDMRFFKTKEDALAWLKE